MNDAHPPRGYHHGNLRSALEAAALELVVERGTHGFTLAEASRRAGVSTAAPFRHFAGRGGLLAALARRGYEEQERRFSAAVRSCDDPSGQLAEFAAAYIRFSADEPGLFQVTFESGIDKAAYPELEVAGAKVLEVLLPPCRALRRNTDDSIALLHAVAALAHGYAVFLREGVLGPAETVLDQTQERARAGARALAV